MEKWQNWMTEQSGGRLKFVSYHGGSLLGGRDLMTGAAEGTADITSVGPNNLVVMPLTYNLGTLPFLGFKSMPQATQIYLKLYDKYPEIQDEWKEQNVHLIYARSMPPVQLFTTEKPVQKTGDIKGLKIGFTDIGMVAQVMEGFGAVPVQVSLPDMIMSLSSGLIEGWSNHIAVTNVFGALEYLPNYTKFGDGGLAMASTAIVMNENSWNNLPPDLQEIIMEGYANDRDEREKLDWSAGGEIDRAEQVVLDQGGQIIELTPEEIAQWSAGALDIQQAWVAEMETEGYPAQAIYDDIKKMVNEIPE
jgi:TRAP-type C4-dicarboxylate transport system substrate-binding protein